MTQTAHIPTQSPQKSEDGELSAESGEISNPSPPPPTTALPLHHLSKSPSPPPKIATDKPVTPPKINLPPLASKSSHDDKPKSTETKTTILSPQDDDDAPLFVEDSSKNDAEYFRLSVADSAGYRHGFVVYHGFHRGLQHGFRGFRLSLHPEVTMHCCRDASH